jgi:hypothetical protein
MRTWALAVVLGAAVAAPAAGQPPANGRTDGEAVAKAWAARQGKVTSFAFEWVDTLTLPRGRISRNRPDGGMELKGEVPPHDLVFPSPRSLLLSGEKARFRYAAQHWSGTRNAPFVEECDASCDGTTFVSAAAYDQPHMTPTGVVKRAAAHTDLTSLGVRPIVVALRGAAKEYKVYDPAAYEPSGRTVAVNGVRCAELVRESRAQGFRSVLLVDPARDFVLVRSAWYDKDKLSYQVDVSYAPHPVAGWVPAAWEHVLFDPSGKVYLSGRAKATRTDINPAIPDDALACVPPPGTLMVDMTERQHKKYVVQPDGGVGKKVPRSAAVSYQELKAAGPTRHPPPSGPWAGFAAASAGSVGLLGWRAVARARRRGNA